jgi:uncharacterized protein YdeI (YjbR/CyaY-like superfamily)
MFLVEMDRDDEPRVVVVPSDLEAALAANPAARAVWEKMSYTHRKENVQAVLDAKRLETRLRRIEKTVEMLLARK